MSSEVPFYSQTTLLDRYIHAAEPAADSVAAQVVVTLLKSRADLRRYFFASNPSPGWAQILWNEAFFLSPPEPEVTGGGTFLRPWDMQFYLQAVAHDVPDIAVRHVETIEGNAWYLANALRCLNHIPAEMVERILPRVFKWLEEPGTAEGIAAAVNDLIIKLAEADRFGPALDLFRALANTRAISEAQRSHGSHFGEFAAGSILELTFGSRRVPSRSLELLEQADLRATVEVLKSSLVQSLRLEAEASGSPAKEFSSWWRTAIEDTDQDMLNVYQAGVMRALRHAVLKWAELDLVATGHLVRGFLEDRHTILRRLGLYVLSRHHNEFGDQVCAMLLNRGNLDDVEIHHEFALLLQNGFGQLAEGEQRQIESMLLDGPNSRDAQELADWAHRERGADTERYLEQYRHSWIRDRLWLIREHLHPPTREMLSTLVTKLGEPEHPLFLTWSSGVFWVKDVSPMTEEELARLDVNELAGFLLRWQPDAGQGFGPERVSHAGLSVAVANLLHSDLARYGESLSRIASLRPELAGAILERWTNVEDKVEIPWPLVMRVCKDLLANEQIRNGPASESHDDVWRNVRLSIARLMDIGLRRVGQAMPDALLPEARDMLLMLLMDPDPTPSDDCPPEGYFGHNDPITVALNHVRPVALRTLILCALRISHHGRRVPEIPAVSSSGRDDGGAVLEALEARLDPHIEPSRAVRCVFGQELPTLYSLDKAWVERNLDKIFPQDDSGEDAWLFVAASDGYLLNPYIADIAMSLRAIYSRAIENLARGLCSESYLELEQHLAAHAVLEYLLGDYELASAAGKNSLVCKFLSETPAEIRGSVGWALWRVCEGTPGSTRVFWPKALAVWRWRNAIAASAGHSPECDAEMVQFAQLLLVTPASETLESLLPLLEGLLPHVGRSEHRNVGWESLEKYLAIEVDAHPMAAIRLYRQMYEHVARFPSWFHHSEESRKIVLEAARNQDSRQVALDLIDFLGRQGDRELREVHDRYSR